MRTLTHPHIATESHGIDLAPMLDFVVNLLIFFIVTAVFVKQTVIELNRPTTAEPTTTRPSMSIVIDMHGEISVDAKTIDLRAVRSHIERFRALDSNGGIVIVADRQAPTGVVVAVADHVRRGGIEDITFTTVTLAPVQTRR